MLLRPKLRVPKCHVCFLYTYRFPISEESKAFESSIFFSTCFSNPVKSFLIYYLEQATPPL